MAGDDGFKLADFPDVKIESEFDGAEPTLQEKKSPSVIVPSMVLPLTGAQRGSFSSSLGTHKLGS